MTYEPLTHLERTIFQNGESNDLLLLMLPSLSPFLTPLPCSYSARHKKPVEWTKVTRQHPPEQSEIYFSLWTKEIGCLRTFWDGRTLYPPNGYHANLITKQQIHWSIRGTPTINVMWVKPLYFTLTAPFASINVQHKSCPILITHPCRAIAGMWDAFPSLPWTYSMAMLAMLDM